MNMHRPTPLRRSGIHAVLPCALFVLSLLLQPILTAAVPWLHVEGNQIKDAGGHAVTLRGVSLLAPEHNSECTTCGGSKPISEMLTWSADASRGWYSRVIRLSVTTAKVREPEKSFKEIIDPYVQLAVAKGLYIIVDLHYVSDFDAGSGTGVKQQTVLDFWNYVAPRYAGTPNVLFEVFNEPINPDSWSAWKAYIQPVVDSIRAVAPDNLILVGNPQWSTRVNGALADPITGGNIVYVYHLYPNQGSATATNLDAKFGNAANTVPVMLTEFGWNQDPNYSNSVTSGTTSAWGAPFRTYLDARPQISWSSYIFDNYWKPQYFDSSWNLMSGENQGAFMQQWFAETKDSGQPQPAALTAAGVTDQQIDLTWPATAGATAYHVKRAISTGGPYTLVATVNGTTYADTGLSPSTLYHYVVSASTAAGEGPDSAEASAATDSPGFAPDVPLGLSASGGDGQITLSWKASAGATSYTVKRATVSGGPYTTLATGIGSTSLIDSSVQNGQLYFYVVSAVGAKESAPSAEATDLPSSVTAIVDNADTAGVVVTGAWSSSSGTPGFYGTSYLHDGNSGQTGGKSVRFTPTLPVGGAYLVSVRWTAAGNRASNVPIDVTHAGGTNSFVANQVYHGGEWVPIGVFTCDAGSSSQVLIRNDGANGYVVADAVKFALTDGTLTTPAAPANLAATALSSSEISLQWTDTSDDEAGFRLDSATDASFTQNLTTTSIAANATSHVVSGLAAGVTYHFRIRAFNIAGESANSNPAVATTLGASAPAAPSQLAATAVSAGAIDLTWIDHAGNEDHFELEQATDAGFTANRVTTTIPADATQFSAVGLTANTTYYFRLRAANGAGLSSWSSVANATTSPSSNTATVTLTVNQQTAGSTWNTLGTFSFAAGSEGCVRIRTDGTSGYVVADAVKFSMSGQPDLILDSEAAGGISVVGDWADSTGTPGYWGSGYKQDQNAGKGTKSVTYTPNLPAAGNWTVSMYWTAASNRASNVPVDIVHASGPGTTPDAPTSLAVSGLRSTEVDFVWTDHASNETGFELQRANDSAFTTGVVTSTLAPDTTTCSDTGLAPGTAYAYRLRAINAAGASGWSNVVQLTTPAAAGFATAFVDQRSGGGAWHSLGSFPFAAGSTGTVKIRTDGTSGYVVADAVKFSLAGQPDIILDSENATGVAIVGTWGDSSASPGYWGTGYKQDQNAGKGGKSVTYTPNLPAAGNWTVFLRWTSDPNRAASVPVDITYTAGATSPAAPSAPSGLTATAVPANGIDLTWADTADNEVGFELQQATSPDFTAQASTQTLESNTSHLSVTDLAPGATYYFRIRALAASGASSWSDAASATLVGKPVLTWTLPAPIPYGTPLGNGQLNARADVPGTFSYTPAAGTVLGAGDKQLLSVTFTPADEQHYARVSASTEITVQPALATVVLGNLTPHYDGAEKAATVLTDPSGLPVRLTYAGGTAPPIYPGSYSVVATVDDPNFTGSATGTLELGISARVRHGPTLNGGAGVDGSLQVLLAENATLNGGAWISGDLLLPGTPAILVHGKASYVGVQEGPGDPNPATHHLTLNGQSLVRYAVRRVDPAELPEVLPPAAPKGTRDVSVNAAGQPLGDLASLRNLTLNGNAGAVAIPPGTYGVFTANGRSTFVLGDAGSTNPARYELQSLTLNSQSRVEIVGPVELTLNGDLSLNSEARVQIVSGSLLLRIAAGGVTLNGNSSLAADVVAPSGSVTLHGSSQLRGTVTCDRLILTDQALLVDPAEAGVNLAPQP